MKTWYIRNNDEHLGPYSIEELKLLGVYSDDYVWKEGLEKWTRASEVTELSETLIPVEPVSINQITTTTPASIEEHPSLKKLNKLNESFNKIFGAKGLAALFKKPGSHCKHN